MRVKNNQCIEENSTHSKSSPSKPYFVTRSRHALTNAVRFCSVATAVEKYCDPVQPPIDRVAFTFYGQDHVRAQNRGSRHYPHVDGLATQTEVSLVRP